MPGTVPVLWNLDFQSVFTHFRPGFRSSSSEEEETKATASKVERKASTGPGPEIGQHSAFSGVFPSHTYGNTVRQIFRVKSKSQLIHASLFQVVLDQALNFAPKELEHDIVLE